MEILGGQPSFEVPASVKQSSEHHLKFTKAYTDPRFARGV